MAAPLNRGSFCRRSAALLLCSVLTAACSTLEVPVHAPQFEASEMLRESAAGIDLEVRPIQGRDIYWSLFDDNLPEAGIGALWVSVHNTGDIEVDLSKIEWTIRRGQTVLTLLDTDDLFKRYYRERSIRLYTIFSDRQARLRMENVIFHAARIRPSRALEGFLFFRIEPTEGQDWIGPGTLLAENIRLQSGRKAALQVRLSHANP